MPPRKGQKKGKTTLKAAEPSAANASMGHPDIPELDLVIVGAGASGVGCGVMAKRFGVAPSRTLILERGSSVGSTFDKWPEEMRFITPSFNQQAFGFMDLNSVAFDTSPAQLLHEEHPTGPSTRSTYGKLRGFTRCQWNAMSMSQQSLLLALRALKCA